MTKELFAHAGEQQLTQVAHTRVREDVSLNLGRIARPQLKTSVKLHKEDPFVLHPNQFHVNEAWIVFKLNDAPIHTKSDGDFNFVALMDAASCFILSSAPVPASAAEPSEMEAKRLLKEGQAHKQQFPKTLFIPSDESAIVLTVEAERQGITVVRVPEDQLLVFIGEARESFRESWSGGSTR